MSMIQKRNDEQINTPLLSAGSYRANQPRFVNYDEDEEATCIDTLSYLRFSKCKTYFIVPLLCICSAMIFALFLFWY